MKVFAALGLVACAGCFGPLVSDGVPSEQVILPGGSDVLSVYDVDPEKAQQIEALDQVNGLVPRLTAFAGGEQIFYFDFGTTVDFAVPLISVRERDENGDLQSIGHPSIVDVVPGDPGYSPFWVIWHSVVTDDYGGEIFTSFGAIQEGQRLGLLEAPIALTVQFNCPIVGKDITVDVGGGVPPVEPFEFFYKGMTVPAFGAGVSPTLPDGVNMPIAHMFMLRREGGDVLSEPVRGVDITGDGDASDSNNLFQATRADSANYTPLLRRVTVTVPSDYESIDTLGDADAQFRDVADIFAVDGADLQPVAGNVLGFEIADGELCNCPVQREPGKI